MQSAHRQYTLYRHDVLQSKKHLQNARDNLNCTFQLHPNRACCDLEVWARNLCRTKHIELSWNKSWCQGESGCVRLERTWERGRWCSVGIIYVRTARWYWSPPPPAVQLCATTNLHQHQHKHKYKHQNQSPTTNLHPHETETNIYQHCDQYTTN